MKFAIFPFPFFIILLFMFIFPAFIFGYRQPAPEKQKYFSPRSCYKQFPKGYWQLFQCPLGNDFCYVGTNCSTEDNAKLHDHRGCINLNRKIVATKTQNGANQTVVNCTALGLPHCQECRICEENYCNGAIGGYEYGRTTLVVIVMIGLAMMMY